MNVVKVTILLKYDFLKGLPKVDGSPFWQAFQQRMHGEFRDFSVDPKGNTQAVIYLPSQQGEADVRDRVEGLLSKMLPADAVTYVLSVSVLSEQDINYLKENNVANINEDQWFRECLSADVQNVPAAQPQAQKKEAKEEEEEIVRTENRPAAVPPQGQPKDDDAPAPEKKPESLSETVQNLLERKAVLLDKVKGQRHAVEEVINALFEAEAFSSQDPKRVRPQATFLFAGPSGVGKSHLAKQLEELLHRKCLPIDMSEYSDNLANGKLNGEFGKRGVLTDFVRKNPNAIIIFDEIEKAHINTIHMLLQVLDEGRMHDETTQKSVSFKDTIIFITTNAGASLYEDTSIVNLSNIPRRVILEALKKDKKPNSNNEPYFPECIVTRFANGHVVLFNHLEPYALKELIKDEVALYISLFKKSFDVEVEYDPEQLAALILYNGGGVSDARTLKGLAKQMIVKELQESLTQLYEKAGDGVNRLKKIVLKIDAESAEKDVSDLFVNSETYNILTFCEEDAAEKLAALHPDNIRFTLCTDTESMKKSARGCVDFVLIDPLAYRKEMSYVPHDVEDVRSDGMEMFRYIREFYPDMPVYILNTGDIKGQPYGTLLAKGAHDVLDFSSADRFDEQLKTVAFNSHVNNAVFHLGRAGKVLKYNCSQYAVDETTAVVLFSQLEIGVARSSEDKDVIVARDESGRNIGFDDVIGCRSAKEALREYCAFIADPKKMIASGRRIPKGVLLYGPPGTGKTMLAQAMANEAGVPFIPATATSFFASLQGETEQNIRNLFARARKYAPSIIFIDEVDAIARQRTGSVTSVHNEDALNQFIAEMEGFSTDEKRPVFIMAATNYEISGNGGRVLDGAFVRRFDKRIFVNLPDTEDRKDFFRKNLQKHGIDFGEKQEDVIENMAKRTGGLSCSDMDKIVNMYLSSNDSDSGENSALLMDMVDAFRYGDIKETPPDMLRQVATHESGHALVNRLTGSTPLFLTVVSRGDFGGYMAHDQDETGTLLSFKKLMNLVCCALGGRVAEIEIYGEDVGLNIGASSDIERARSLVQSSLDDFAMGENLYRKSRDTVCEKLLREQYERTQQMIREHRNVLLELAEYLYEQKSLDQPQLEAFFQKHSI
ncbi:MAG: AAA family ATPase [Ruminococcus sp.]|nr:AAA family ATPase [Ruminococcus sp.]